MKKLLLITGFILTMIGTLQAQLSNSEYQALLNEYLNTYYVHYEVGNSDCGDSSYIAYALINQETGDVMDSATAAEVYELCHNNDQQGFYVICHFQQQNSSGDFYINETYKGGFDTIRLNPGTYWLEMALGNGYPIRNNSAIYNISDNYATEITINEGHLSANAFRTYKIHEYNRYIAGNHESVPCMSTGQVCLEIRSEKFPYTVTIRNHDTHDIFRTDVFTTNQNHGAFYMEEDYRYYYYIDSLPAGNWDFSIRDNCGSIVDIYSVSLKDINMFPSEVKPKNYEDITSNFTDSNCIGVKATIEIPEHCFDELRQHFRYRFTYGEDGRLDSCEWRQIPGWGSVNLLDTVERAHAYCDIWDSLITFECRLVGIGNCDLSDSIYKSSFRIRKPNDNYKKTVEVIKDCSILTIDACDKIVTTYVDTVRHSIKYVFTRSDSLGFYTEPLTWLYQDWSASSLSDDTIKADKEIPNNLYYRFHDITGTSWISLDELEAKRGPTPNPHKYGIKRSLVDAKGCVLYETRDTISFGKDTLTADEPVNVYPSAVTWLPNQSYPGRLYGNIGMVLDVEIHFDSLTYLQSIVPNRYAQYRFTYGENGRTDSSEWRPIPIPTFSEADWNGWNTDNPQKFRYVYILDTIKA